MNPPYRTANTFLADTSELLLVKGVSVQDYNNLTFYISALPGNSDINVNTASPRLLQSLTHEVTLPDVERIIGLRTDKPFQDIDVFVEDEAFAGKEISENHLTVSSQYFLLTADVMLGNAPLTLQSVLHRTMEGKITVIQRRFGPSRERILTQTGNKLGPTDQNERS
jgi:general secretion pathway protein K